LARQRFQLPVELTIFLGSAFEPLNDSMDAAALTVAVLLGHGCYSPAALADFEPDGP
jgi:hypothetical protein